MTSQEVPTNWVQAVEASMDSSHVGVLHESTTQITAGGGNERVLMTQALAPKLEFEERPYGYRYAALRALPDDKVYARVNNFVMPWYGIICPPDAKGPSTVFFSTPVDDVTHRAWFVHFNPHRPLGMTVMSASPDVWNFPPLPPGDADAQLGPEPRPDEARPRHRLSAAPGHRRLRDVHQPGRASTTAPQEQLCSADGAVLRVRSLLLKSAREFQAGKTPTWPTTPSSTIRRRCRSAACCPPAATGACWPRRPERTRRSETRMNMNRRRLLAAACASLAAPAPACARRDKPVIRILVGLPPGGGTDAIARVHRRPPAQLSSASR